MVSIASRSSWGARFRDGDITLAGLAGEVFLHHTVTALLPANASVAQEQAQMRSIEQIGQNRFGTGISYNVIIFPSGRAYQGVSWNRRGTHTGGRNSTSRSIALAGNFETATPTGAALAMASAILRHGRGRWWTNGAPLRPHQAVSATACAGRNLNAQVGNISAGTTGPTQPPPPVTPPGQLVVDGRWGSLTTARFQQVMGTPIDGVVSSQWSGWRQRNPGLTTGWQWVTNPTGSTLIRAVQGRVGSTQDGKIGPNTLSAMQRYLGTAVSGEVWLPSPMVRELQSRLNQGRF